MREPQHASKRTPLNLAALRERLDGATGPRYWRGLEELSETDEFLRYVRREFPEQADSWDDPASRRQFLRLMAASLALAGVSGCAFQPPERIVPYVKAPEEMVQGKPLFFSTAMSLGGDCIGLLVESQEGRPIKIEGNALHPASPACLPRGEAEGSDADGDRVQFSRAVGSTDIFAQAELLNLYDPDRSQSVLRNGRPSTWEEFQAAVLDRLGAKRASGSGEGLRLLTGSVTSPTLADQVAKLIEALPGARWHQYEPINRDNARLGAIRAFGKDVQPIHHVDRADRILALDADFLSAGPGHLVNARGYADRRDPDDSRGINRLYAVECNLTVTGSKADHRLPLKASQVKDFALALARELGVEGLPEPSAGLPRAASGWIGPVARDLKEHAGASLVIAGDGQPPVVHALAHAINVALGNVGSTVEYIEPVAVGSADGGQVESLRELVTDLKAGKVDTLVMLGVNPVYDAPVDLDFRDAMLEGEVLRVHSGLYLDETGELCQWHVPEAHFLESWGDARAFDGTATLVQPLIKPLFAGRSAIEIVAALRGDRYPDGRLILESYWSGRLAEEGTEPSVDDTAFQKRWRLCVHDGLVPDTASPVLEVALQSGAELAKAEDFDAAGGGGLELVLAPDPTVYDGRYANNAWLQECPKPITKLTWDNALMVPASMVASDAGGPLAGLQMGDLVGLTVGTVTLDVPIYIMPGHANDAVTLHLGYGRRRAGRVGDGTGFDAYAIRSSANPWIIPGVSLNVTGRSYELASTQLQRSLEGRDHIREATLDQYRANPDFAHAGHHTTARFGEETASLYPSFDYSADRGEGWNGHPGYAWGMTVDLNRCTGCSACIVACQAENNIPVVGKREVKRGRVMHWMEVDRYFAIDTPRGEEVGLENPKIAFQPRFCMHCEKAPCEPVCPVEATVHDHEGLNNMVYNRCVGTRYCSNNCPYKVRKFNFLKYTEIRLKETALSSGVTPLVLLHNPDVTVRSRGVMEKCTYCVQRIYEGKIQSELEGRRVRDGEIVTACQSACPTRALVFGDLNDESAEVTRLKKSPRNYGMLAEELNTRPRTTYLARVTNPNPEIATA